jgi:hypothetical protein
MLANNDVGIYALSWIHAHFYTQTALHMWWHVATIILATTFNVQFSFHITGNLGFTAIQKENLTIREHFT